MAISTPNSMIPIPRLQPISFFSTGRRGSTGAFSSSLRRSLMFRSSRSPGQGWLHAAEENPRDRQPDPGHKAEEAHEINRSKLADPLLPKLPEVRQHADGEEGQHEEDHAKDVGFADGSCHFRRFEGRPEREVEPG